MRRARAWGRGLVVALVGTLIADQLVQHTVLDDGELLGHWVAPFDPPLFTDGQHRRRLEVEALLAGDASLRANAMHDATLGWCPAPWQEVGGYLHGANGERISSGDARAPTEPKRPLAIAIGGSFTQGAEVTAREAWPALAAKELGFGCANLGVAGYGVGQALLRFERDGLPLEPDEVWLGFLPEGVLRITTQFPPILHHWSSIVAFKPRFTLDSAGRLLLHENPAPTMADRARLLRDQEALLGALGGKDLWLTRTPSAFAPRGTHWTHHFATTRLALSLWESGDRDPATHLREEDSAVRRTLVALFERLRARCEAAGIQLRVFVLPSRRDLEGLASGEPPYWRGFTEELGERGFFVLDTTAALVEAQAPHDPSSWMPNAHYSPHANRTVADALVAALATEGGRQN